MSLRVFQICWNESAYARPEPGFEALDWRNNPQPALREFAVFRDLHKRGEMEKSELTGAFSPKFAAKANVSGREFIEWTKLNPGYDVYVVNPRPQHPAFFFNGWSQSRYQYGNQFMDAARELFEFTNYDFESWICQRQDFSNFFCMNYWVGNRSVWDRCVRLIEDVLSVDRRKLRPETDAFLFTPRKWRAPNQFPIPQITLVLERAVTSFVISQQSIKKLMYPATHDRIERCCRNPAEWILYQSFAPVAARFDAEQRASSTAGRDHFEMAGLAAENLARLYHHHFGHANGDDEHLERQLVSLMEPVSMPIAL
ncbi:MAG: hypothetical protein HXX10_19685 [Rhodoplanes sp.]|uniref:hypothetical protein n=1 Tax=Rhodoplanes sp. TaxID=1968906 RepID=UPI0017C787DF|nr:hypothetical protein [Rhodoplanes sp.]NVO16259.1 hypothetical protein [Rhodoplanes sp.]